MRTDMRVKDELLIKNLAHTAELINTLNGGMSQPVIRLKKDEDEWILRVRIPGVSIESLKIEVKEQHLFLFQMLKNDNLQIQMPYLISAMPLTEKIDKELISAEYRNGEVLIILPFDELKDGFHREIEIVKD